MSTHNIGFDEGISKIITSLSSNIIKYAPYFFCCDVFLLLQIFTGVVSQHVAFLESSSLIGQS